MEREKWKYKGVQRRGSNGVTFYVWHCEERPFGSGWVYAIPVHEFRASMTGGRA